MESMLKGNGEVTATTVFQLLDPASLHGAQAFFYDFFLKGEDGAADGIWQIWDGAAYQDVSGATGVAGEGDTEWMRRVEIDQDSTGLARIERTAGTLSYWYALSSGNGRPTYREANGSVTATVEFILETCRSYQFTANGDFVWNYWDGAAWVAFADGTESGFVATPPPGGRVQLVVNAGTVIFAFASNPID